MGFLIPAGHKRCAICDSIHPVSRDCLYCLAKFTEAAKDAPFPVVSQGKEESAKIPDRQFESGAMRSTDSDQYDFASLPLFSLLSLCKVAGVGGVTYGRHNYQLGMPAHECLNHAVVHIVRWLLGDRSEPHLAKAAWNCLVADQSALLDPGLNEKHLLGPGGTMTDAKKAELEEGKPGRDAKRRAGEFVEMGKWTTADLPEIIKILAERKQAVG